MLRDIAQPNSVARATKLFLRGLTKLGEAIVNEHVRVHVQQRSRVPVPVHDPSLAALLLPHHEGPLQRHRLE